MTRWRLRVWTRFFESPERVWERKTDLDAIEAEFPRWLPFSVPADQRAAVFAGEPALARFGPLSWPLQVREQVAGQRYVDTSENALYAEFIHEHSIEPSSDGCRYIDDVVFVPRFASKLVAIATAHTFVLRHRRAARGLDADARTVGTRVLRCEEPMASAD
jgi:ligand-binding SRPBCC domain-containing protein